MSTIVVFQPDSRARARLSDALARDYELRPVDTWAELARLVRTARAAACIVDIYAPGKTISPARLGKLREECPDLAIVVYSDFSRDRLDPFELGRHGVDDVIDAGDDDAGVIRRAVAGSLGSATAGAVASDLDGRLPVLPVEALRWAVENAARQPAAGALARAMGMSRARLARQLRSLKAPSARQLLLWGRLLHAARLLDRGSTIEATALQLGYASGSGLQRAFRRSVGFPPGDVTLRGGLDSVLHQFLDSAKASAKA
jgi:AraC-like DNA-binding protein